MVAIRSNKLLKYAIYRPTEIQQIRMHCGSGTAYRLPASPPSALTRPPLAEPQWRHDLHVLKVGLTSFEKSVSLIIIECVCYVYLLCKIKFLLLRQLMHIYLNNSAKYHQLIQLETTEIGAPPPWAYFEDRHPNSNKKNKKMTIAN